MGNGTVYKRITIIPTKNNRYFDYTDPIYASIINVQYLMSREWNINYTLVYFKLQYYPEVI